ncbi:PAAR-like protein [Chryseobacterium sp. MIQD13]|uniref:PAAR-like protein n=1 Tax=Chryseobacterium sp. MIQD13 TaxID=3422310 RepID=UPI003D2D877C
MSKLYVPDGAWLVCSDGMKKQQIKVTSQSTVTIAGGYLKATTDDRPGGNFMCAKMVIGGAILGAAIAAVLVAGSIVTGGALAVAAGAAIGAGVGLRAAMLPSICGMLLKDWTPYDKDVLTVGKHPLLENSMIPCRLGGNVMILYSEKAADEFTDKVIAETVLTVGAIICVSYLATALATAIVSGVGTVILTGLEYGITSAVVQGSSMAGIFIMSYGVNAGYDWVKDYTGFENYVTGEAYGLNNMQENVEMVEATDKLYGAASDGLGAGKDIANGQISGYGSTTASNSTLSQNRVFIADNAGNVTPPGTTVTNSTISANNQLPNSSIGASRIEVSQTNSSIRITPNTTTASTTNVTSVYGTQYNNSLRSNMSTGVKETFGGGRLRINGLLKGLGINLGIDIFRATANWALASQIKDLNSAMLNEEAAARAKITVLAGKD